MLQSEKSRTNREMPNQVLFTRNRCCATRGPVRASSDIATGRPQKVCHSFDELGVDEGRRCPAPDAEV